MSYQFMHLETYSRKSSGKKFSVSQIIGEANRTPGSCPHVKDPRPPELVYGMDLSDLEALHASMCEQATETNKKGIQRSIRKDQQTLGCVVLSYPNDGEDYNLWEDESIKWLKETYGDDLKTVIKHTDESHPHLHCYLIPKDLRASKYNVGRMAKDAFMQSPEALEIADKKERNKLGDRAYKDAWRRLQDSYWQTVSLPCGLSRIGPKKRRLTRDQWQAEQKQARHLKVTIEKGDAWGQRKRDEVIAECKRIKEQQLKHHDEMKKELESISEKLKEEKRKLEELTNQPLIKKLYNKFFKKGYEKGILENKQKYEKYIINLKSKISELSESVSISDKVALDRQKTISRMETEKMESRMKMTRLQELNKSLSSQVEGLQERLNAFQSNSLKNGFKV